MLNKRLGIRIVSMMGYHLRAQDLDLVVLFLRFLNVLHAWEGKSARTKKLFENAVKIEMEILKEPRGKHDHYMVLF